jgi:hypothetical protein
MSLQNLTIIRDKSTLFTLRTQGPAKVETFPSISAAKRAVRTGGFKLGQVRKLDSLLQQIGQSQVTKLIGQGKEALQ